MKSLCSFGILVGLSVHGYTNIKPDTANKFSSFTLTIQQIEMNELEKALEWC